jgi:hypothetical protein
VQVDPIEPKLKLPGTERLKLKCDILLSTSAFKFNMRRYTLAGAEGELAEFTAMAEEATGHHNDRQNIHYHHRVKAAPARHSSTRHIFVRLTFQVERLKPTS